MRSIKVIATEEQISRFELNRRLHDFQVEPGTEFHSPKYGLIKVKVSEDGERNLIVVNADGQVV